MQIRPTFNLFFFKECERLKDMSLVIMKVLLIVLQHSKSEELVLVLVMNGVWKKKGKMRKRLFILKSDYIPGKKTGLFL